MSEQTRRILGKLLFCSAGDDGLALIRSLLTPARGTHHPGRRHLSTPLDQLPSQVKTWCADYDLPMLCNSDMTIDLQIAIAIVESAEEQSSRVRMMLGLDGSSDEEKEIS